jgi:hypothetical protein
VAYLVLAILITIGSLFSVPTNADPLAEMPRLGIHTDIGIGEIRTQPYAVGGEPSASITAGISAHCAGPFAACLDLQGTAGRNPPKGNLESANGGKQTLVTFTFGLLAQHLRRASGAFANAGLGVGHSTISAARARITFPPIPVALRDRSGTAYTLGFGYRFPGGRSQVQVAIRAHGLLRNSVASSAYATVFTLGVAY